MIVGTSRFHRRHYGEDLFVTIAHKFGGMPLAAIEVGAAVPAAIAVEQLLQEHAPHLMHGRANGHLAGFQIQVSQPLAILQHLPHEPVYFLFRFSTKFLRSFFFNCSSSFSSLMVRAGRNCLILSLTAINSWDRRKNAWYRSPF